MLSTFTKALLIAAFCVRDIWPMSCFSWLRMCRPEDSNDFLKSFGWDLWNLIKSIERVSSTSGVGTNIATQAAHQHVWIFVEQTEWIRSVYTLVLQQRFNNHKFIWNHWIFRKHCFQCQHLDYLKGTRWTAIQANVVTYVIARDWSSHLTRSHCLCQCEISYKWIRCG